MPPDRVPEREQEKRTGFGMSDRAEERVDEKGYTERIDPDTGLQSLHAPDGAIQDEDRVLLARRMVDGAYWRTATPRAADALHRRGDYQVAEFVPAPLLDGLRAENERMRGVLAQLVAGDVSITRVKLLAASVFDGGKSDGSR